MLVHQKTLHSKHNSMNKTLKHTIKSYSVVKTLVHVFTNFNVTKGEN